MNEKTFDLRGEERSAAPGPLGLDPAEVVEVPVLLSAGQMTALEQAAHCRGLTAGEMLRRLLGELLRDPTARAAAF